MILAAGELHVTYEGQPMSTIRQVGTVPEKDRHKACEFHKRKRQPVLVGVA